MKEKDIDYYESFKYVDTSVKCNELYCLLYRENKLQTWFLIAPFLEEIYNTMKTNPGISYDDFLRKLNLKDNTRVL